MTHPRHHSIRAALAALFVGPLLELAFRAICGDLRHYHVMRERVSPAWTGGGDTL